MAEKIIYFKDEKGDFYRLEERTSSKVSEEMEEEDVETLKKKVFGGMQETDWEQYLENFCQVASELPYYKRELGRMLSDIDMKISDIMHYIEFYEMDTEESIQMVKLLKECRKQRRQVKDELLQTDYFQKSLGTAANLRNAKTAMKQIEMLGSRIYHPRRLGELFEK